MKIQILDINGKKAKEIESKIFEGKIRKDITKKIIETEKQRQRYAPSEKAGQQTSAGGNVRHLRHAWKSDRGRGLARVPKKRMSDKGERFVWVGAVIPSTRGGRRAHPPHIEVKKTKINKNELMIGLKSSLAMSVSLDLLKQAYSSLEDSKIEVNLPLVVDSRALSLKTKEFLEGLKKILDNDSLWNIAIQKKTKRAGKGKMRNRKYKKNAGLLCVIGNKDSKKIKGIDIKKVNDLKIKDLSPNNKARLILFTDQAIIDLQKRIEGGKNEIKNK